MSLMMSSPSVFVLGEEGEAAVVPCHVFDLPSLRNGLSDEWKDPHFCTVFERDVTTQEMWNREMQDEITWISRAKMQRRTG